MNWIRALQSLQRSARSLFFEQSRGSYYLRNVRSNLQNSVPLPFSTALFNFSIDFELAWGLGSIDRYSHDVRRRKKEAEAQSENFLPFVALLEELQFPVSWAILGCMLEPELPLAPSEKFRPKSMLPEMQDWYRLPDSLRRQPELWQGQTYLEALRCRLPYCEILSHGYGHIDYGDEATTSAVAEKDLAVSQEVLSRFGFNVKGFVFPCNRVGHVGSVHRAGYLIARGEDAFWHIRPHGLHLTPVGFWISPGMMSWRDVRQIIDEGVRHRAWVHPWMHLIECRLRRNDLNDFYRPLFEYVLELQVKKRIQNISFGELARRLRVTQKD